MPEQVFVSETSCWSKKILIGLYFVAESLPGCEEGHDQELGHEDGHVEGERGPQLCGDVHGVQRLLLIKREAKQRLCLEQKKPPV